MADARGKAPRLPPATTAHAALLRHLRDADPRHFQPMNVNWGLFPAIEPAVVVPEPGARPRREKRPERNARLAQRALADLEPWLATVEARPA